jgi:hypothetical protein
VRSEVFRLRASNNCNIRCEVFAEGDISGQSSQRQYPSGGGSGRSTPAAERQARGRGEEEGDVGAPKAHEYERPQHRHGGAFQPGVSRP